MTRELEIVPYDPMWVSEFERERHFIAQAMGPLALRIDHNGSTAVPGLAAKPVVDIQVSVERLHPISSYSHRLEALGYLHKPHPDDSFCPFFGKPGDWPRTHHLHVVEAGGLEERRTLAFRDYLRSHSAVAREYEALKRQLIGEFTGSTLQSYAEAKSEFIERVISLALQAGLPRDFS